jgi:hypothetical protein
MRKPEAKAAAEARLRELRALPYGDLSERFAGRTEANDVLAPSGVRYQLEVQGVWDDREGGNLRVIVSVDDGGLRAFAPLSADFIISPGGSFVGE